MGNIYYLCKRPKNEKKNINFDEDSSNEKDNNKSHDIFNLNNSENIEKIDQITNSFDTEG